MQEKSKKYLSEENATDLIFPLTVTKKELKERYRVSYKTLKAMFAPKILIEVSYTSKRVFTPVETHTIFSHLEPERYQAFLDKRNLIK